MSDDEQGSQGWDSPVERPDGVTGSERHLKRLADRSFLSLWSHAGVYRDQGKTGGGHGKEVCDLLVVFDNHVIIFSDKDCEFPNGDLTVAWGRWYRKAIKKSADQVYGAERWIREQPDRLFLDRECNCRFPISLPPPELVKFHRVVVAHGVSRRCRQVFGASGSLAIAPHLVGDMHCDAKAEGFVPFVIGQIDPKRGYVHVFDDESLNVVMANRDTITDFVEYLSAKEDFVTSGRMLWAAGEEDLLAYYLQEWDEAGKHAFLIPSEYEEFEKIAIAEGEWEAFQKQPERLAQLREDRISYIWDGIIEWFAKNFLDRTLYTCDFPSYSEQEKQLRFLAREPRHRRRLLSKTLVDMMALTPVGGSRVRVLFTPNRLGSYFAFLTLDRSPEAGWDSVQHYREARLFFLRALCCITKLVYPEALDIVGLATESGPNEGGPIR